MEAIGLLVTLEAHAGKEAEAEAFLKSAQRLALNEKGTLKWYAIKIGPRTFGIFDTFANDPSFYHDQQRPVHRQFFPFH